MSEATPEETAENRGAGTLSLEVAAVIPLNKILNLPDEDMPPIVLAMLADGNIRWARVDNETTEE